MHASFSFAHFKFQQLSNILIFLAMVLVVQEHHLVKQTMVCAVLVLLTIPILPVNKKFPFIQCLCCITSSNLLGIRLLDGRITTLLEARALTLFAVNISIKSASWG
jgi:hypothetical protein